MRRLLLILFVQWSMFNGQCLMAQDRYWAIGTAVPGGVQELTPFPNKQFKYTGRLIEGGTLRFCNKESTSASLVRFLKPTYEDAYAVTNPTPFTIATARDSLASFWTVPLTEDVYRITIDLELFIVGGATECGWVTYTFLPFTRDEDEVCTWDWTGELKERPEFGEPRRFKFLGQNAWEPKALHPFSQDEDILGSTQLLTGGIGDNKWNVRQEGYYHIRVDVFRETVQAEYLGAAPSAGSPTAIDEVPNDKSSHGDWFDISGRKVEHPVKGIYIKDGRKVIIK